MFVLKFDVESAYALGAAPESDENWAIWIDECLEALESIIVVLKRNDAPATFFVLGNLLERAAKEMVEQAMVGKPEQETSFRHLRRKHEIRKRPIPERMDGSKRLPWLGASVRDGAYGEKWRI